MAPEDQDPSSLLPSHEYSLLLSETKEYDQWPLTHPFEHIGDSFSEINNESPSSLWIKPEAGDFFESQMTSLTSETRSDLLDAKADLELQEWHPSQDVMDIILGGDLKVSEFNVRLDDDIYINATKQSAVTVFPVHTLRPVLLLILLNINNAVTLAGSPSDISQTYRWRGDLGLLDRLSYKNSHEIPRNWEMTSMDSVRIKSIVHTTPLSIEEHPKNPISIPLLDAKESAQMKDVMEPEVSLERSLPNDTLTSLPDPPKKKRTRVDKRKRVKGNNRFGRKGALKCAMCRRRRTRCVFTFEDRPCEFCRDRGLKNCIKLATQKHPSKEAEHRERSFLNGYGKLKSLISTTDMKYDSPLGTLIQQVGHKWFRDITDCLEWAILAWAARGCTPSECRKQLWSYGAMAVNKLNLIVSYARFDQNSVFASNLIAWVAYSSCSDEIDPHVHFKHSLAILNFLEGHLSEQGNLAVFGPFIIDCANAWAVRNGAIPHKGTTFRQRTEYFDHLGRGNNAGTWYTGILEAANSTLGNLFEVSLTCVYEIIAKEVEYDFTRDNVDDVLQYIRAELGDVDLHQALTTLNQSFQGLQTNHTSVEGQLITRIFHRLRCVLLLQSVLEGPSVEVGVRSPKVKFIAEKVILFCRKRVILRDGPIEDYYLLSWHNFSHLLLGGIGLSPQESPDLCKWVIDELEFIGKEECARCLEMYWMEPSSVILAEILNCARFPDQWQES